MIPKRKPGRPRKQPQAEREDDYAEEVDAATEFAGEWDTEMGVYPLDFESAPLEKMKPAPPSFMEKLHIDSRVVTLRFVAMAKQFGVNLEERRVGQILAHAGLSAERGRGFELLPALFALIEYYKRHSERRADASREDVDRKKKMDADAAEVAFLNKSRQLVPLAAAKSFWSDARTELRKVVELAGYLTKEQKAELLKAFQGLKTELKLEENTDEN